jgi:site-specific recombinase XerD
MTATMRRYLAQLGESLKPRSIDAAEAVLRQFAGRVTEADASCRSVAAIERSHVEDYLAWLRARPGQQPNSTVLAGTIAHRVGLVAKFFERVIAWGYEDAPPQSPISRRDAPPAPRPPARGKRLSAVPGPMTPAKRRPAAGLKGAAPEVSWEEVAARAPEMAATMRRYLDQLGVSARPTTVRAAEGILRLFAGHVSDADPTCRSLAVIERRHIEGYKLWLAARPGAKPGKKLSPVSIRHCLGTLRTFFERVIEWGYPDAPPRVPVYAGDLPRPDEPLPRFLDDPTAAKFMATLAVDPNPRRRLMIELLARTGMRVGELSALEDDAMVHIRDTFWLRIPVGKLHNDRYVPLHPLLVELIDDYRTRRGPSTSGLLVQRDDGRAFDRRTVHRYVAAVAKRAGVGHVHPHQLRHTLATQAINRGMSIEAIAALLGHRSMRMTLTYARISDRTVAEEYAKVTDAVEARYRSTDPLPADAAGANMRRLAAEAHQRLLGNGHCTRPVALDCQFESICERCGFFDTGPEFIPILRRQRDHAADHGQSDRAELFRSLLWDVEDGGPMASFS